MLLEELAQHLPRNSVWLGLSKLQSPEAWSKNLGGWNNLLMERVRHKQIHVCRIWALRTDSQLPLLLDEMRRQERDGVAVRYSLDARDHDLYPDMSLIWEPRPGGVRVDPTLLAADHPLRARAEADYQRLPGLSFDIGASMMLNAVSVLHKQETLQRGNDFAYLWLKAVRTVGDTLERANG